MSILTLPTEVLALIGCPALLVVGLVLLSARNYLRRVRRRLAWRSREEARGNDGGGSLPIFFPVEHPADFDRSDDSGGDGGFNGGGGFDGGGFDGGGFDGGGSDGGGGGDGGCGGGGD